MELRQAIVVARTQLEHNLKRAFADGLTDNDKEVASCSRLAPIRNKLCLNEGLLKTQREPHGITRIIYGRMRALDTAESNAITT